MRAPRPVPKVTAVAEIHQPPPLGTAWTAAGQGATVEELVDALVASPLWREASRVAVAAGPLRGVLGIVRTALLLSGAPLTYDDVARIESAVARLRDDPAVAEAHEVAAVLGYLPTAQAIDEVRAAVAELRGLLGLAQPESRGRGAGEPAGDRPCRRCAGSNRPDVG